ncbi:MAG TPA: metalloregulator ArsR/SmtB family transcription factor [Phycisphaerae bacterium]|nr:metalloregulator ArsR/SmtB family transcription factor [Phycisphaerae bacterium]
MKKKQRGRPAARECCADVAAVAEPRLFKALCDPNRIALLARLAQCGRPCTVGEISCCCPVDLSVVSRHLAILRDAGVLDSHKKGKEVFYAVRFNPIAATLRSIADAIEACRPRARTRSKKGRK